MNRYPKLNEATLTPKQREVYEAIANGPRGQVAGPLRVWLQSPELASKAQALGQFARYDSSLPDRLSELAILVTGRYWSSGFEWSHHVPIARAAGVPDAAIKAIALAQKFEFKDPAMQAVFDFATMLHRDKQVSDAVYQRALDELGQQGCVDLVGVCGYYTLISMTINVFEVPDGEGPALPQLSMTPAEYFTV